MPVLTGLDRRVQRNLPLLHCFTFLLGLRLYIPVWLVYFRQLGLSDVQSGQLWAFSYAASLLTEGITGVLADRWGYRYCLMLGGWLLSLSFIGFYFGPTSGNVWWCLAASMALMGVAATLVYNSTPQAFGSKSAKKVAYQGGYKRFQGLYSANIYFGSALAAGLTWVTLLFLRDGARIVWAIQVGLSFGLVAVAYATQDLDEFRPDRKERARRDPREAIVRIQVYIRIHWRYLLKLVPFLALAIVVEPFAFTAQAYGNSVHLGVGWITAMFAIGYVVSALAAFRFSKLQLSHGQATASLTVLLSAGWLALAGLPGRWQLVGILILFMATGLPYIAVNATLDQLAKQYKATAFSVYMTVKLACYVVAWPVMGWMFQNWSFRFTSLVMGAGLVGCMVLLSPLLTIRTRSTSLRTMCMPTPWAGQLFVSLICPRGVVLYT